GGGGRMRRPNEHPPPRRAGGEGMTSRRALLAGTAIGFAMGIASAPPAARAQQAGQGAVAAPAIDADDIGGGGARRMGAGSGVGAETTALGRGFAKRAGREDCGRFVVPDLPKATSGGWVRGYGLFDPPKVTPETGKTLNLTAVIAPSLQAAAQYYPAFYW